MGILVTKFYKHDRKEHENPYEYMVSWHRDGRECRHFATIDMFGRSIDFCCTKYPLTTADMKAITAKMDEIYEEYKEMNPCAGILI